MSPFLIAVIYQMRGEANIRWMSRSPKEKVYINILLIKCISSLTRSHDIFRDIWNTYYTLVHVYCTQDRRARAALRDPT